MGDNISAFSVCTRANALADGMGYPDISALCAQYTGLVQHSLCNLSEALVCYEKAFSLCIPSLKYMVATMTGVLLMEMGQQKSAADYFSIATDLCLDLLKVTSCLHSAQYSLGLAYIGCGKCVEAVSSYRKALGICSERGIIAEAMIDLELLERATPGTSAIMAVHALLEEAEERNA